MYSSILVVGGGMMFKGANNFLLRRLQAHLPVGFQFMRDQMEVIIRPKVINNIVSKFYELMLNMQLYYHCYITGIVFFCNLDDNRFVGSPMKLTSYDFAHCELLPDWGHWVSIGYAIVVIFCEYHFCIF